MSRPGSGPGTDPSGRPALVTAVVVLTAAGGTLALTAGVLLLGRIDGSGPASDRQRTLVTVKGVLDLVVGGSLLFLARLVARGNTAARWSVGALAVLSLMLALYAAFRTTGTHRLVAGASGVVAAATLSILFSARANDFFRRHRDDL